MVINTNILAQTNARFLNRSSSLLAKSLARLSSGLRIVSPDDDAASLAVSTRFDAQISRIAAARSNLGSASSFSQTQDGYLAEIGKSLDRMSELSVLAQDSTKTDSDRALYNTEFQTLAAYVNDVATKDFNGVSLFDGNSLAVTTDGDANTFNATGIDLTTTTYTDATSSSIATTTTAATALTNVSAAITQLATDRATVGANLSRIKSTSDQLAVLKGNLSAATSRIKDVDIAEESTQYAKYNLLVKSGTAMLAQANAIPLNVLSLIS